MVYINLHHPNFSKLKFKTLFYIITEISFVVFCNSFFHPPVGYWDVKLSQESENNVQHLTEALSRDELQIMELKKELERLKSCCSCHKLSPVSESSGEEMELVLNRAGTRMETPSHEVSSSTFVQVFITGVLL